MIEAAAAASHFAEPVDRVAEFGGGLINRTFLVTSSDGELVLQRINSSVFTDPDAVMSNIVAVHGHLGGALVPVPAHTHDGHWLHRDRSGGVWRAWRRVQRAGPCATLTRESARSAALLLGRFHAALADLDPSSIAETLPRFHDPRRRLELLRAAVERDEYGRVDTVVDELASVNAAEALVDVAADLMARTPTRVAHNDASLDNILFRDEEAVCLVDLDTLMPGAWFWDVGDLVRTAATMGAEDDRDLDAVRVDDGRYEAVVDGYIAGAGDALVSAELDALEHAGAIVTFEQAVRFLTDWLEGDVYYRVSRPRQNLDRARAQLHLLASMPGTVGRW